MIEYELTRSEYLAAQTRFRHRSSRKLMFRVGLAGGLILLLVGLFPSPSLTHGLFPLSIILLTVLVAVRYWLPPMVDRLWEATLTRRPELLGPKRVEFQDVGVIFLGEGQERKLPWRAIRSIEEDNNFIYLCSAGLVTPLPKSAFGTKSREEFLRCIRSTRRA